MQFLAAPRIGRKDLALILIPTLIWSAAHLSRPHILKAHCADNALACSSDGLFSLDRAVVPLDYEAANQWSGWTQNASGVVAVAAAVGLQLRAVVLRTALPPVAWAAAGTDLILLLETTIWNGAIMESFRVLVQRPRPFVYRDPVGKSGALSHYTSFYSGHTSFAAAAGTALILILISRGAPLLWTAAFTVLGCLLTFFTGFFRVWAGKHFVTDVAVGAIAGILVALMVRWAHRPNSSAAHASQTR